ncbi:M20 family metallopeptidase [Halorarum halophilum]|uniref:M20 family metallopeptidase n=1 Tax=Halorarum halophilum TaxID=2743090 RepID=A0A7D5GA86_9EURY|nr:M20 family metallopeptidase [Halobaculum halophilum]QLG26406.1 M20 family metallopeptidase [Halobaculum halophilum]
MTDEFDPVEFLVAAVRVDSHESVEEMRELLVETLADAGEEPVVDDAGNVRAAKGRDDGPHLVLNTHIDTVPPGLPVEREGDVLRGRGACDAKGPLAALLAAFLAVEPSNGRLTLAITPDEETISTGAHALVTGEDALNADMFVVGEPTDCDVCTAARGRFEGTLALSGGAAHAAEPESGVNAVAALESALGAIRRFDDDRDPHPRLGAPTLVPTGVGGGEASNQVPAEARLTLDRRSVPPETAEGFRAELTSSVREVVPRDVGVEFSLTDRPTPFLEAFDTDAEHELVGALATAASSVGEAGDGEVRPFGAATEASYFAPAPTVVFGPGHLADDEGAVAHSEREYVRSSRVRTAAEAVTRAVDGLVG